MFIFFQKNPKHAAAHSHYATQLSPIKPEKEYSPYHPIIAIPELVTRSGNHSPSLTSVTQKPSLDFLRPG